MTKFSEQLCTCLRPKSPGFCNDTYYCANTKSEHFGHILVGVHPVCKEVVLE